MRIVYHNSSITNPDRWAGERARQLAEALNRTGVEIRTHPPVPAAPRRGLTRAGAARSWLQAHTPSRWLNAVIRLRLLQRGTINTVRWSWRLWRDLRASPPDVVLSRYHEYEWTPLIVAWLLRRPLVLEVHAPFGLEATLRGQRPSRLAGWMDRTFFRRSDLIWVHTPELGAIVAGSVADPGKIRLIPFGVADPNVLATPGAPVERVEFCFVGSFYQWHGLEDLLAAFSRARLRVPGIHLTLAGDGVTRAESQARAASFGLGDAVAFPGWLDRRAVYSLLQHSHVGVAPYRRTRYNYFEPVKILDYQMAGLPVVASAVGHIPEMVDDGVDGVLVPPGDVEALTEALVRLAADPELRRDMGRAARRSAQRVDETAEAVVKVCREAAAIR